MSKAKNSYVSAGHRVMTEGTMEFKIFAWKFSIMSVKNLVTKLENNSKLLQEGTEERFNGYGLMGLTFKSGHVLALRRFMASSIGPGYRSVWHRAPGGRWSFYADVEPSRSCARYFGEQVTDAITEPINISWTGEKNFKVEIENTGFQWQVSLCSTPATGMINLAAGIMPGSWWKNKKILKLMSRIAGKVLGAGHVGLSGFVPNRQYFIANPYKLWLVSESHATLDGEDFGAPGPLTEQAHLKDFWIPQKGIFALGLAYFEPFNKENHSANYCRTGL